MSKDVHQQSGPILIPTFFTSLWTQLNQQWYVWFFLLYYSQKLQFHHILVRCHECNCKNVLPYPGHVILWKTQLLFHCCKTYHAGRSLFIDLWWEYNPSNCFMGYDKTHAIVLHILSNNIIFSYVLLPQKMSIIFFFHIWHSTIR